MKIKSSILILALTLLALTASSFAQEMVSPVYIPGTDLETSKSIKAINHSIKKVSGEEVVESVNKGILPKSVSYTKKTSTNPTANKPVNFNTSASSSVSGCGCDSGCASTSGCGCASSSGCGCASSSGCGCATSSGCGCDGGTVGCGCDRVGRSFFGRLRDISPIKFSVNRSCDGGCDGCDNNACGGGSWLSRILPVSFDLQSNHCCRYTSFFAGGFDLQDYRGEVPVARLVDFNEGWQIGIKRGRVFANGVRLESEQTFRHSTNDTYNTGAFVGPDFVPAMTVDATDSIYQLSSMTNVLKDLGNFGSTTPYVGLGLGGVYADGDIITPGVNLFIEDYAFAYQLIAGARRQINNKVSAFVEYKYFGSSGVDVEEVGVGTVGELDLQSSNVNFGLQFVRPR